MKQEKTITNNHKLTDINKNLTDSKGQFSKRIFTEKEIKFYDNLKKNQTIDFIDSKMDEYKK